MWVSGFKAFWVLLMSAGFAAPLSPEELARRTRVVFEAFDVPELESPEQILRGLTATASLEQVNARLPYLDPKGALTSRGEVSPHLFRMFQYPMALGLNDFDISLSQQVSETLESEPFSSRSGGSLHGLRILIDPGHAGSDEWSQVTGKWVKHPRGPRLNEGELTLATAWALRNLLASRGADARVTRSTLNPAIRTPLAELDYTLAARIALRDEALQPWFRRLLHYARDDNDLIRKFRRSPQIRSLFAPNKHKRYVMDRFDLWERSNQIRSFRPHLTLVLHYDAAIFPGAPHGLQRFHNFVKAYIPGGFQPTELAAREDRVFFAWHLTHATLWDRSRMIARRIVRSISESTGLPLQVQHGPRGIPIEPGIFARNLFLTRSVLDSPVVYLECAHYNHVDEYRRLNSRVQTVSTPVGPLAISLRELSIAQAIADAL